MPGFGKFFSEEREMWEGNESSRGLPNKNLRNLLKERKERDSEAICGSTERR